MAWGVQPAKTLEGVLSPVPGTPASSPSVSRLHPVPRPQADRHLKVDTKEPSQPLRLSAPTALSQSSEELTPHLSMRDLPRRVSLSSDIPLTIARKLHSLSPLPNSSEKSPVCFFKIKLNDRK